MAARFLSVAAVLALCAAGPLAAAQPYTFTIDKVENPPAPIRPNIGAGLAQVHWTLSCIAGTWFDASRARVVWQVETPPPGMTISGSPEELLEVPQCPMEMERSGTTSFNIQVGMGAKAFERLQAQVMGSLEQPRDVGEPSTATANISVVPGYEGVISVNTPSTIIQGGPGATSTASVTVTNLGNGPSVVRFAPVQDDDRLGHLVLPEPARFGWAGEDDATQTLEIEYRHPEKSIWNNWQETVQFTLTPASADEPENLGAPVTLTFLFRTRGFDSGSEAPGVPVAVLLVALVVLALRRRGT